MKPFRLFLALILAMLVTATPALAAYTTLTAVALSETASTLDATAVDSTNGNQVINTQGDVFLVIHDTDGANPCTATIIAANTSVSVRGYGPLTKANLSVALTAGQTKAVGPFPALSWNSSGYLQMTWTGTGCTNTKVNAITVRPL